MYVCMQILQLVGYNAYVYVDTIGSRLKCMYVDTIGSRSQCMYVCSYYSYQVTIFDFMQLLQ